MAYIGTDWLSNQTSFCGNVVAITSDPKPRALLLGMVMLGFL